MLKDALAESLKPKKWSILSMINKKIVFEIAKKTTAKIKINLSENMLRHEIVEHLRGSGNIGIELGVAEGVYSKRMMNSNKFARFFGVDVYSDTHDTTEYKRAIKYVGLSDSRYTLLRMTFEDALDLFEDEYFDYIYIDGFAHTGEEGGKSLIDWHRKLKVGGIFAGDDYHDDWPLVKWAVNDFANQLGTDVTVTSREEDSVWSSYPSWFIIKPNDGIVPSLDEQLYKIAMTEKKRIHNKRNGRRVKYQQMIGKILKAFGLKQAVLNVMRHF